ncbi:MAG: NAD(P)-binding domain-containing protein [Prolixibacteraceae bacterium]|jgi:pyrroline-5-carboxylate reductase|nr:NAD(P)-binding domain-containing protein [Prolixibacteraceae bacterium]NLO02198.1 NAD(P)-binding domain-containing protein [Bacteroidales bacterium]
MNTTIGFIGGGRITKIFLEGFKNKAVKFKEVKIYDHNAQTLDALKNVCPQIEIAASPEEAAKADVIIIAVHPPVVMETLDKIAGIVNENTIVVSLAPKITIEKMASKLKTSNIVRMIPNATSYINKGYNPLAYHPDIQKKQKKQIKKMFNPLGKTFETEEYKLEGYAIISGMLPTYFWFQWQELETIGEKTGLSKKEAAKTIRNTLKNAITLYYKSGLTPEEVIDLIPVKPIGENEEEIKNTLNTKLLGLFEKIRP